MDTVATVRSFNRTVTQRIGVLEDNYLSRTRPLGQARLMWEIGSDGGQIKALRRRLELDSGYLSRLLRALEADGLVVVDNDPDDQRVRTARLTPAGQAELAELDRLSDELVATILAPLNDRQRGRLAAAMAEVEKLLAASMVTVVPENPRTPEAQYCLRAYATELGERLQGGYDPARSRQVDAADMSPPRGVLLVASLRGQPVGCGALWLHADESAEVKRMWVAPAARGLGVGRRLITELETHARGHGVRVLRLDTNHALAEAIALYRSSGYYEIPRFNDEPYADHFFEKELD
jgi:DNA-binding MarR family transcriptional regulator/ribosomal protein S18 acetylase RimI-like enzyme